MAPPSRPRPAADALDGRSTLSIVDTYEAASRLSAEPRMDLVRLGLVEETGCVPLGMQGTFAGRGDLMQALCN